MTSSARAKIDAATVRPSASAVLALTMEPNLTGSWIVRDPPLPRGRAWYDRPHVSLKVSSRIYADSGNLKDARANNFQLLPCFCQTCKTPILVLVTLPSSSLSDTHR